MNLFILSSNLTDLSLTLPLFCPLLSQFNISSIKYVLCWVIQSCMTLCDPVNCSPPGSSVHGASPGKNTGLGCHVLLQGLLPTYGLNPGLPHCRQILYHLSHQRINVTYSHIDDVEILMQMGVAIAKKKRSFLISNLYTPFFLSCLIVLTWISTIRSTHNWWWNLSDEFLFLS